MLICVESKAIPFPAIFHIRCSEFVDTLDEFMLTPPLARPSCHSRPLFHRVHPHVSCFLVSSLSHGGLPPRPFHATFLWKQKLPTTLWSLLFSGEEKYRGYNTIGLFLG